MRGARLAAMSTTPFPLGRILQHDPRSRAFPARADLPLHTRTWRRYGAVLDQGHTSSCTGHAMAQVLNHIPLRRRGHVLTGVDAMRIYSRATVIDEWLGCYPPDDTGSSGLAVAKAAKEEGLISAYDHAFGLDHALHALMAGPVIVGSNWYSSMFRPQRDGRLLVEGTIEGGHEWTWVGVDMEQRLALCLNSWGVDWGVRGRFWLTLDDLDRLLREDGDVTVPLPTTV